MPSYHVAKIEDLQPGERKIVTLDGRSIGVFNINGQLFALRNRCPHQGAALCDGSVVGLLESDVPGEYRHDSDKKLIKCPWHGWEFDVSTGQSWFDPQRVRVGTYPVTIEDESTQMSDANLPESRQPGPYKAETYPVSVEGVSIVVHL